MVSLRDIARRTGLSVMTVSRALREGEPVSVETRKRVRECADRLGYRPNASARSLRTGRGQVFCVICRETNEREFARIAAFSAASSAAGYAASVVFVPPDLGDARVVDLVLNNVLGQRAAGAMLLPDRLPAGILVRALAGAGLALAVVDPALSPADRPEAAPDGLRFLRLVDVVWIDRQWGVREAMRRLVEEGRRRIVYAGLNRANSRGRLPGYLNGLREAGLAPRTLITRGHGFQDGRSAADRLLAMRPVPEAVFCYNDTLALGILHRFSEQRVRVPESVAVVGFDDRPAAAYAFPELTTVALPNREAGEAAAAILLRRTEGCKDPPGSLGVTLKTRLIVRRSA